MLECPAVLRGFSHPVLRLNKTPLSASFPTAIVLLFILCVAALFRWYGLAWDSAYLFHPDERQILMVASRLQAPSNLLELFSMESPLNPHFFAYGSLPIYLLRFLAPLSPPAQVQGPFANDALARWIVFGRSISGLFDLGTILMTFLLGRKLYGSRVGLLAAAAVAVTVLHIQLSHFYAVDTLLTFFVLATLYSAASLASVGGRMWQVITGISFGLAMATKVTALPLLIPIAYALARGAGLSDLSESLIEHLREVSRTIRRPLGEICVLAFAIFVITQPYIIIDWYSFGRDVIRESFVARGWLDFPYILQYAHTTPYLYGIWQTSLWGMGLPLGLSAWAGASLLCIKYWRNRDWRDAFVLIWGVAYFGLIGGQFVKYPRYLLPLLPVLYLMAARVFTTVRVSHFLVAAGSAVVLGVSLLYSIAFVSIYGRIHPWLTASRWIYDNLTPGSTIAIEEWDDALPVLIDYGSFSRRGAEYVWTPLHVYEPETNSKLESMAQVLANADAVVLASQRAYGSIGRLPKRFPKTIQYYDRLFNGELGFDLVAASGNYPTLGPIVIQDDPRAGLPFDLFSPAPPSGSVVWDWGFADESLTVYDHPQPFVFVKRRWLTPAQLEALLAK